MIRKQAGLMGLLKPVLILASRVALRAEPCAADQNTDVNMVRGTQTLAHGRLGDANVTTALFPLAYRTDSGLI